MVVRDLIGVAIAIVVLAGVAVALTNSSGTVQVMNGAGQSFSNVIKAAAYGK